MSRSLFAFPSTPYIGQPYSTPVGICRLPTAQEPRVVPLAINWQVVWAALAPLTPTDAAVNVSLESNGPNQALLDKILGVKIDNTDSPCAVYVYFEDTQDVITCPPNTVVFLPVLTNGTRCKVAISGLAAAVLPQTRIFLCNFPPIPNIDPEFQTTFPQWKASPEISRGVGTVYGGGYNAPALGDQTGQYIVSINTGTGPYTATMFGGPQADGGFIYVTAVAAYIYGATNPSGGIGYVEITSTGVSGRLYLFPYHVSNTSAATGVYPIYSSNGKNLKLAADETWEFRTLFTGGANNGLAVAVVDYTYNPNE